MASTQGERERKGAKIVNGTRKNKKKMMIAMRVRNTKKNAFQARNSTPLHLASNSAYPVRLLPFRFSRSFWPLSPGTHRLLSWQTHGYFWNWGITPPSGSCRPRHVFRLVPSMRCIGHNVFIRRFSGTMYFIYSVFLEGIIGYKDFAAVRT